MKILFICKYNRFRSKIAESYLNSKKIKGIVAKSAGIVPGIAITTEIIVAAKKSGINICGNPQGINHKILQWADIIIVMSDKLPKSIFYEEENNDNKKVIVWKMPDAKNVLERPRIIADITNRVDKLILSFD